MYPGQPVRLNVPENSRLHGALAFVERAEPWGAHVRTDSAATGQFRALYSEMMEVDNISIFSERTGDPCDTCGSLALRRAGACLVCASCGTSTGC